MKKTTLTRGRRRFQGRELADSLDEEPSETLLESIGIGGEGL